MPYPVQVKDSIAISDKKLDKFHFSARPVGPPTFDENTNMWSLPVELLEDCNDAWASAALSLENYTPDLSWADNFGYEDYTKIVDAISRGQNFYSKTEIEMVVEFIVSRPESSWLQYIDETIIVSGITGVIDCIIKIDQSVLCEHIKRILDDTERRKMNIYKINDKDDVINRHTPLINVANNYMYYCDSLIEKFLIKTNGFNQCFIHDGESYSSVVIKEISTGDTKQYKVYIYGADDSSYTRILKTFEAAKFLAESLTKLSKVIYRDHLKSLGFTFTN